MPGRRGGPAKVETGMQIVLKAERLGKAFPAHASAKNQLVALEDLNFEVAHEQILCIVGPSGCGKSTLLDIIAGFATPTSGTLEVEGAPVKEPHPDRGVVFQQPVLFPWLTVYQNVVLGPAARGAPPEKLRETALSVLTRVGLQEFLDHYPYQLSGGMKQRVQIARVLVASPAIILMDEPFGALDAQTRSSMHELLLDIWEEYRPTIIFITHDVEEAIYLADRVIVMSRRPGRIQAEITVPFARPRRFDLIGLPEFGQMRTKLVGLLRDAAKAEDATA
jgi:NitT/TauT family transport system ATP-binding protein